MADVSLDDFGVDHQTLGDVLQGAEDDVGRQEGLGEGDPPALQSGGGGNRTSEREANRAKEKPRGTLFKCTSMQTSNRPITQGGI